MDIKAIEQLCEFMKREKLIKAKTRYCELELHPSAFFIMPEVEEEKKQAQEEQKDEYEKFLYPSIEEMKKGGL